MSTAVDKIGVTSPHGDPDAAAEIVNTLSPKMSKQPENVSELLSIPHIIVWHFGVLLVAWLRGDLVGRRLESR